MKRAVLLAVIAIGLPNLALAGPAAGETDVVKEYQVTQNCTGHTTDGWCAPLRSFQVKTTKKLVVFYRPSTDHCTPVDVGIGYTGSYREFEDIVPGGTAQSTWDVARGSYEVAMTVRDAPGGCDGQVQSWGGLVRITTTDDGTLNPTPKPQAPSTGSGSSQSSGGNNDTSNSNAGSNGGAGGSAVGSNEDSGDNTAQGSAATGSTGSTGSTGPESSATPSGSTGLAAARVSDETPFPFWILIVAVVAVALLGGGGYYYWRRRTAT